MPTTSWMHCGGCRSESPILGRAGRTSRRSGPSIGSARSRPAANGDPDLLFEIYQRQNLRETDDFSCGIAFLPLGGKRLTLARYNGPSHEHGEISYRPRIHRATARAIEAGGKPEREAMQTDRFATPEGALACLTEDFNLHGLDDAAPDHPSLPLGRGAEVALMALDVGALRKLLRERLCEDIGLTERRDGALLLRTHFELPDGDRFPIHVAELAPGGLRLSDHGHTLMHISYDQDVDSFLEGFRGQLIERIMAETGLAWEGGAFCLDTPTDRLPEAIFRFGQALTRIHALTLLSRSKVRSTFYDDLADLLTDLVDENRIERDYLPQEVPNPEAYRVDYRIRTRSETPLFLYGVPNRDKARLTTIMLSHFHRHELRFESLLVFEDQAEIPRLDLARLSDVGGETISSLESGDNLSRKLLRHMA